MLIRVCGIVLLIILMFPFHLMSFLRENECNFNICPEMSSDLKKKEEKKRKKKELHNHLESAADNDKHSYFMMFCHCNVLGQRLAKFEHAEVPLLYS